MREVNYETVKALEEDNKNLRAEADRYMRALVHIRSNAESILQAHAICERIAGEGEAVDTPNYRLAHWTYTEANAALTHE